MRIAPRVQKGLASLGSGVGTFLSTCQRTTLAIVTVSEVDSNVNGHRWASSFFAARSITLALVQRQRSVVDAVFAAREPPGVK
jgi:hypothetical protein